MVKITDVAAKAGVAKSTVSNVLTGRKFVSEELRQKVLTACKELDFQPNFCASGLSSRRTNIIALLLENTTDIGTYPFYKDLMMSCLTEASVQGYSLLVYYDSDKTKLLQTLRQGRAPIDGAVLLAPGVDDERLVEMENNRITCVVIGRPSHDDIGYVDIDNKGLVVDVVDKLIEMYGKNIYLLNSSNNLTISQDRDNGFVEVCAARGIDTEGRLFHNELCSEEESYDIAMRLAEPNAVFVTANEGLAKGVYRAVADRGLSVGKDVGVFALGRSIEHGHFAPKLSYACQSYEQLGKIAVDALINEIRTGEKTRRLVDSCIIFRDSTQK